MTHLTLPTLPKFYTYCRNTTAVNALCFRVGNIQVYYSYITPVAFEVVSTGELTVRVNDWSNTTGKHLNAIDGGNKKGRVSGELFETMLKKELDAIP